MNSSSFNDVMALYSRIASSHLGSSLLFGGAFFAATLPSDALAEAVTMAAAASVSWFASVPLLKRLIGATAGA